VIGGGDLSDNRLLADVVRSHISGGKLQIRNPKSTRPWQHVLDPLNGYVLAMEKALQSSQGETFNFGPSEPALEVSEVVKEVQEIWNDVDIEIVETEENAYESKLLDLDSDYARTSLSWSPKYSQRQAIRETLNWWDEVLVEKRNVLDVIDGHIQKFFT
jgi:CDP-glucose 4,6-dehydratase